MKKLFLLLLLAVFESGNSLAQFVNTGKVIDKQGLPLSGATVRGKGLMSSTTTNMDGSFSLETTLPIRQIEATYMGKKKVAQRTDYTVIVIGGRGGRGGGSGSSSDEHPWFFNAQGGFYPPAETGMGGIMIGYSKSWGGYINAMYDFDEGIVLTAGIIKRVYKGINVFVGGGIGSYEDWKDYYYKSKNDDTSFVLDAGLLFRFSRVSINLGVATGEETYPRLGIGYSF